MWWNANSWIGVETGMEAGEGLHLAPCALGFWGSCWESLKGISTSWLGLYIPTQIPVSLCLAEILLSNLPARKHLGQVVGGDLHVETLKENQKLLLVPLISIHFRKENPTTPSFRSGQRGQTFYWCLLGGSQAGVKLGMGGELLRDFSFNNLEQGSQGAV